MRGKCGLLCPRASARERFQNRTSALGWNITCRCQAHTAFGGKSLGKATVCTEPRMDRSWPETVSVCVGGGEGRLAFQVKTQAMQQSGSQEILAPLLDCSSLLEEGKGLHPFPMAFRRTQGCIGNVRVPMKQSTRHGSECVLDSGVSGSNFHLNRFELQ